VVSSFWLRVDWLADRGEADPCTIFHELSADRFEVRKVELFDNGSRGIAAEFVSTGSTDLAYAAIPGLDEINGRRTDDGAPVFRAVEIGETDFNREWQEAVRVLKVVGQKYCCRCCCARVLDEPALGSYIICGNCGWEDDPVQNADLAYSGGANSASLLEVREHYLLHLLQFEYWKTPTKHGSPNLVFSLVRDRALETDNVEEVSDWIESCVQAGASLLYRTESRNGQPVLIVTAAP
jgi:hypothetical protein